MTSQPAPGLEDELAAFRREWQEETKRRQPPITTTSAANDQASTSTRSPPARPTTSPKGKGKAQEPVEALHGQLEGFRLDSQEPVEAEREKERPKSALDLYSEAVRSEQEGRLNDGTLQTSPRLQRCGID